MGFVRCSQHWCVTDESDQLWCVEYDIIEKGYIQMVELRGIDAGHEFVQVSADPLEQKTGENGEDRACLWRGTPACPVRERSRGLKSKGEIFESGQGGEGSDHRFG